MRARLMFASVTACAGIVISSPALKAANPVLAYASLNGDGFGSINLLNGDYTSINASDVTLAGMAELNDTLYGETYLSGVSTLYTINPSNGDFTSIGTSAISSGVRDFGSVGGTIYALDANLNLYTINPSNGAATLIGPIGLTENTSVYTCLSNGLGTLYFGQGTDLYTINTTTGLATEVGPTGGPQIGSGIIMEQGTLYGLEDSPSSAVDTVNAGTGAMTVGPGVSGTSSLIYAIGQDPVPVPEPAISGVGLAVAGVCALRRRRNRDRGVTSA